MALAPNCQDTTLISIFDMTMVLLNRLVRRLSDLPIVDSPEKEQDRREPVFNTSEDIRTTLEHYILDLQIWSNDLRIHGKSALYVLDGKGQDEKRVATVKLELYNRLAAIQRILMPLAMRFNISTLNMAVSDNIEYRFEQSTSGKTSNSKLDKADFLELCAACIQLKPWIGELQATKPAIKEAVKISMTKQSLEIEQDTRESKEKMIPNALCLDGGGVRSYSSLLILKALMERVESLLSAEAASKQEKGFYQPNCHAQKTPRLRPADIFGFMCGSSSGGLIAIMLGRLNMEIDDCIAEYLRYTKAVFRCPRRLTSMSGLLRSKYSQEDVIKATRRVVGDFDPAPEKEKWRRNIFACPGIPCRTAVIAWDLGRLNSHIFRTYDCIANSNDAWAPLNPGPADSRPIWQIATATTAAPHYFDPAKIDSQVFADGGISANNPTQEALKELHFLHDGKLNDFCVVSIGSGLGIHAKVPKMHTRPWKVLINAAKQMIAETESTHETVTDILQISGGSYFRVNTDVEIDVRLDEWQKLEDVATTTRRYLAHAEVNARLEECANNLVQGLKLSRGEPSNPYVSSDTVRLETPSKPSFTNPFRRDRDFVDRRAILDQLHKKCALPASRTALVGLGGVGKSQLAIEFGYQIRERSPGTWVHWVNAGSTARFEQSFRDIADYVEIPGRQDPKANVFKLVHDWLRDGKSGQWLLVLDNVDDTYFLPESGSAGWGRQGTSIHDKTQQPISAYLPQSQNGSILVTSRSKSVALKLVEAKDIVEVQPMTSAQALALFEKKLGSLGEGNVTANLAAALDFMPLAIVQAAAYISQRAPRYSVQRYLEDFQKSDGKKTSLLNYEGGQLRRDWEAQNSIIITLQISLEHIHRTWPSAADLLSLMSFFDRQGIPEALVRNRAADERGHRSLKEVDKRKDGKGKEEDVSASECSENDGFEDDIQILLNYSFLSVGTDQTFEMHRLVQLATRDWLKAHGQLEAWKQRYIKNLSAAFPTGEHENWTYCQALFPHVKSAIAQRPKAEDSLNEWASLMYNAAWYALKKGNTVEAVQLSKTALEVRKKILGQEHEKTLRSMGMVGLAFSLGGRWKEAEELQMQVMKISQRVLGEEHPNTLSSMNNLALTYIDQGRWKEAEELELRAMKISLCVLGEEHPDSLNSMKNLAWTYRNQGRWKEAEELELRVTETRKRVLGKDHPDTLTIMNSLALTYVNQGRWKEAEDLEVRVMKISQRVLGEEHPDTLSSMANLASIYWNQGRWTKAEELQMQMMEISKRVLGEEHPSMLSSMANLASIYSSQGHWKKAEELELRAMEASLRVLGEKHPDTLASRANLASIFRKQGRWKEAEELQMRVMMIRKRVLGKEHPSTLTSMANLAFTWKLQGRVAEAVKLMQECVGLQSRILGANHLDTVSSSTTLAEW